MQTTRTTLEGTCTMTGRFLLVIMPTKIRELLCNTYAFHHRVISFQPRNIFNMLSLTRLSIICWMLAYCASISNALVPISIKCRIKPTLTNKKSHFVVRRDLYKLFETRSQTTTINESMIFVSSTSSIPREEKDNTSENNVDSSNSNNNENVNDAAARWRAEAARIRLDAEKMEVSLLLEKIKSMEDKLNNPKWVTKHSLDDIENMEKQLEQLKQKLFPDTDTKIDNTKKESTNESSRSHINDNNNDNTKNDGGFFNVNRFFNNNGRDDIANDNNEDKLRGTSSSGQLLTQPLQVSSKSAVVRSRSQQHQSSSSQVITTTENKQNNNKISSTTSNELEIPGVTITQDANKTDSIIIRLDPISFGSSNDLSKTSNGFNSDSRITRVEEKRDLTGFDPKDLELYLPIAFNIEKTMINATDNEKLDAFRSYPDLQQHFQMKIASLLIQPLKDIQEMESLKKQYLMSSSRTEKESLKRRIDKLQQYITDDNKEFSLYSDTIHLKDLKPISDIEMNLRINALTNLPNVLQTLYKKRSNLEYNDTIELAIELDYYEQQLQLLEQIKYIKKAPSVEEENEIKDDIIQAIESIPIRTRHYIAKNTFGLDIVNNVTVDDLFQQYSKYREVGYDDDDDDDDAIDITDLIKESNMKPSSMMMEKKKSDEKIFTKKSLRSMLKNGLTLQSLKKENNKYANLDLPEYNDIGFIDRSRYIEEFYPSIARMEGQHPTIEVMNDFIQNVIEKKKFMVSNKPERVIGGWYIRGRNLLNEYDGSNTEASTMLVESIQKSLKLSKYKDSLQFFYIPDPSPLTDEDFEMDYTSEPILVVTSKNDPNTFYNYSSGITKTIITMLGMFSILLVAIGATILQPGIQSQLDDILANSADPTSIDLEFFTETFTQIALSMLSIQLSHELGHRIVAWRDKFRLGVPTFIPSIQLGLLGAITPFNTPPPSLKSMFDFGIAGPLFGLIVSLGYLLSGLDITSHMSMDQLAGLPVFPSYLLRRSELGGSLIEYFLGKGTITYSDIETLIPLHPYAIAGCVGIISNALALLPLGNTDGGRIAVAMFGRRGAYIVKTFTAVLLCATGLFGFDESRILLFYVFVAQIWQRELETPALNEVDELDFARGALGIVTALIVALSLVPMV